MTERQQPSRAKDILARPGIGNPPRDDDKLDAEAPQEPEIWVVRGALRRGCAEFAEAWMAAEAGQPVVPTDRIYIDQSLMAGQSKIPQSLVDVLRQAGAEADFEFEPPRFGDIMADTPEKPE